jgi:hypothetical protein
LCFVNLKFNHITLKCKNIDVVATFFIEVIGLKESFFLLMVIGLYSPKNKQNAIIHIFSLLLLIVCSFSPPMG